MVNIVSRYVIGLEGANRFDQFFAVPYAKDFKRFWGFDARQGYDPGLFDVAHFEEHYGRPPRNAEVGCAWSHLNVYKKFLEESTNDDDILIVAEDDALIDADIDGITLKIFSMYPTLGVVVLGDGVSMKAHKQNPYVPYSQISLLSKFVDGRHRVGPYAGRLTAAGLYAMTRKSAQQIIDFLEGHNGVPYWVADEWGMYQKDCGILVYALRPGICGWVGSSTIEETGEAWAQFSYTINEGGNRSMLDKVRIFLAPRARWANFKTAVEATKNHLLK
ncbi:MAG: glycosyltransferase family 25 protein [Rothia sp. (in: high G+C Gram-positive bacteria)]|uniref:glycosyltransferase family 25 protein n=1 Tax=Rothia sp. (in: high G+C Gram-positive bacteria) TaxID=1885016 RepID=UPI0026DFBAF0|nr:glycosyltransferase family 25 protein [Rothia sp. (in: high G+C Gram-positive bacteria)]MDO5750941.1 glycosyltransferase family 25 protein [Rothia sp. (in: high G+C Gram-positive bacteria)]